MIDDTTQLQKRNNKWKLKSVQSPDRRAGAPDVVWVKKILDTNEPHIALCGVSDADSSNPTELGAIMSHISRGGCSPAAICSLNKWKVMLCTPHRCVHKRPLFISNLPKRGPLDASFHQLMEVKVEHDESNRALVLHRVKRSESSPKL